jgi:hypothetical protein
MGYMGLAIDCGGGGDCGDSISNHAIKSLVVEVA